MNLKGTPLRAASTLGTHTGAKTRRKESIVATLYLSLKLTIEVRILMFRNAKVYSIHLMVEVKNGNR
jgi:hypothetical protein